MSYACARGEDVVMATHNYAEVVGHDDEPVSGTVLIFDPAWRRPLMPKRCRRMGKGRRVCANAAVMELERLPYTWWAYCAEHTYSRVDLDDGVYFVRGLRGEDV